MADVRERDPVLVPDRDAGTVKELHEMLGSFAAQGNAVLRSRSGQELSLPHSVCKMLEQVVHEVARGNTVQVMPRATKLSTQPAAKLLKASRPHLTKMLEGGELPYRRAEHHRRMVLEDFLVYKERR